MGIFGVLFGSKQSAMRKQAEKTVFAARAHAISSFVPALDKFPFLKDVSPEDWDYFLTIAGAFAASCALAVSSAAEPHKESSRAIIAQSLVKWQPDAIKAFGDCKTFVIQACSELDSSGHDHQDIAHDALGKWVVWNLLQRAPETQQEVELVRATGILVIEAFRDWWDV